MALTKLWLNITLQITSLLRVYMPDSKCISKWGKGDNVLTCQICPTQKMAELKYETKSDESWKLKSLTSMLCINMKYKRCLKKKASMRNSWQQSANTENKMQKSAKRSSFSWCSSKLDCGKGHSWVLRSVLNREFKLTITV